MDGSFGLHVAPPQMDDGKHTRLASVEDALRNAAGHSLPTASFESLVVGGVYTGGEAAKQAPLDLFFSFSPSFSPLVWCVS